ncbi:MAG: polysaccharide deacetylase family protein [bacterium]
MATSWLSQNLVWRMPGPDVYLTFDDGPDPDITPKLLDLLQDSEMHATFFIVGQKIVQNAEIIRRMFEQGHAIGNHSYSHSLLLGKSKAFILDELEKTDAALSDITGSRPRLFRPPFGKFGLNLLRVTKQSRHKIVLWNASVRDFAQSANSRTLGLRLIKQAKPGRILLLHDGHTNSSKTLSALENSIEEFIRTGLVFSALPEDFSSGQSPDSTQRNYAATKKIGNN